MFTVICWAINDCIQKGTMYLYMRIDTDDETYGEYKIKCANIREYKSLMLLDDVEIDALKREIKINEVIS
jgi:hypothetical protein